MSYRQWCEKNVGFKSLGWMNTWTPEREAEAKKAIGDSTIRYVRLWSETLGVCDEKKLYFHMSSGG